MGGEEIMKTFSFLLKLLGVILGVGFSILVMIYGWGLEPKSWVWILIITPTAHIFSLFIILIAAELDK